MTNERLVERAPVIPQLLVAAAVGSAAFLSMPAGAFAENDGHVTFTKDIVPILQRSCQKCHRPGGAAPMPLVSYDEVRPGGSVNQEPDRQPTDATLVH